MPGLKWSSRLRAEWFDDPRLAMWAPASVPPPAETLKPLALRPGSNTLRKSPEPSSKRCWKASCTVVNTDRLV